MLVVQDQLYRSKVKTNVAQHQWSLKRAFVTHCHQLNSKASSESGTERPFSFRISEWKAIRFQINREMRLHSRECMCRNWNGRLCSGCHPQNRLSRGSNPWPSYSIPGRYPLLPATEKGTASRTVKREPVRRFCDVTGPWNGHVTHAGAYCGCRNWFVYAIGESEWVCVWPGRLMIVLVWSLGDWLENERWTSI